VVARRGVVMGRREALSLLIDWNRCQNHHRSTREKEREREWKRKNKEKE
jgi:hypothetical protein